MTVIEASSVRVSTLVDGTLRVVCDVEPRNAQAAFTLFGSPGVALGIAALKNSQESPKKAIGGPLSQWVGIRCGEELFQEWAGAVDADMAARNVRAILEIESRAEIDNDPDVRERFERLIRVPYVRYFMKKSAGAATT